MSIRSLALYSLDHTLRALDANRDPPNLRRYSSVPAADEIEFPCYACGNEPTHRVRLPSEIAASGYVSVGVCDACDEGGR
jgi:hypothetical protein